MLKLTPVMVRTKQIERVAQYLHCKTDVRFPVWNSRSFQKSIKCLSIVCDGTQCHFEAVCLCRLGVQFCICQSLLFCGSSYDVASTVLAFVLLSLFDLWILCFVYKMGNSLTLTHCSEAWTDAFRVLNEPGLENLCLQWLASYVHHDLK